MGGKPGRERPVLAVFDGHRDAEAAEKASKALPDYFETHFQAQKGKARDVAAVFAFLVRDGEDQRSGSTASLVFIPQDAKSVTLGVLGSSIAVLDAEGTLHIGPDHMFRPI